MKKIFTLLVALVATTALWAEDFSVDSIYYNILADKTNEVEVTSGSTKYSGSVTILSAVTYNGTTYSVTSIGDYAFYGCRSLTSITIPNSVTSIGEDAFYGCSSLTKTNYTGNIAGWCDIKFGNSSANPIYYSHNYYINDVEIKDLVIPNLVDSIHNHAFYRCSSLTSVTIPNSVTSIGERAFYGCSGLTKFTIGNSVATIGRLAFCGCSRLTSVSIPISVTTIESGAFSDCNSLISIKVESLNRTYNSHKSCNAIIETATNKLIAGCKNTVIPNSVTSIGEDAFYRCSGLTSITIPNSVTSIGDYAFYGCSGLTSITIPNSVTSIGDDAFDGTAVYKNESNWESGVLYISNCLIAAQSNISGTCTIKDGTRLIGGRAFEGCSSLTSIIIPESVTHIGSAIVWACGGLTSVTWNAKNCSTSSYSSDSPFYWSNSSITSFTFGNTVERVPSYLCYGMKKLTSMNLPNSVTSIGDAAFNGCSGLTSITIPNSVTSIGDDAFYWCSSLTSITIPNSVTSIGDDAFYWCSSLTSITIPNSVTSIGNSAFYGCSALKSIVWNARNCADPSFSSKAPFYGITSQIKSFILGENVENVPAYLCYGMEKLTSITIPNSVTSIGDYAFDDCSSLTSVIIGNSVTSIGSHAFCECSSLTSITIPESVTSIGGWAFGYCSSLTKTNYTGDIAGWCDIKFGDLYANPMYSSHNFFINDQEIKDLVIPNSVTSIGNFAFQGCFSLTSVTIGESVTSIGEEAFRSCSSLTSVTIPKSVTSIGEGAFYRCSSLTSVTIGESVTSIGKWAFGYCSSLTSITIPNSVTSIGDDAFSCCSSLTSITCEAITPPTIGEDAFYGVSSSTPVYVPCGRVDAYKATEDWKDFTNIQEPLAEYSIEISTSNNQMGSAKVDYNTFCEGNQISAIANYGYHFVQWSDGNTDNPRSLTLTQDTILTAEFAINTYEVTIVAENGATSGAGTYNHGTTITLTATPNEGYHFVKWSDGSTDNPRTIVVTEDINLTAEFAINTYTLTTKSNGNGNVTGNGTYKHGENVIISAIADIGYQFIRWSDGNTDNPRTVVLTQDTVFSAEFTQSFAGQCGENLYWAYNESDQSIAITGTGDMYNYTSGTQPWILFLEKIKKVTTDNTAASLGTSAFEGAIRLAEVHIGAKIDMIEANVFAGCDRLRNIYCYPTYPPIIRESSFARYDALLYIPCDYLDDYVFDNNWKRFENIQCAGAEKEEIESDGVDVDPSSTSVTMTWPTEENANTYTIEIMKGGALFCRLVFNTTGQLLNISFAPSRDGNNRPAQYAELVANGSGLRFTVTGLNERTHYTYDLRAKDKDENTIQSHSGEFTTKSNVTTDMDNIQSPVTTCQKVMRNGQLIIIRDGVEYNAMGQEIH